MKLTLTDQLGDVTKIDFIGIHDNVELPIRFSRSKHRRARTS